jgi:hypothetical protein
MLQNEWFCDCCEKWVHRVHIMLWDESLCDDCLESCLSQLEEEDAPSDAQT